jgi:DNA-binding NtrC family response regulator
LPVIGPSTTSLFSLLRVFAQQEETLLISGPTGAGKSRIARWSHEQSRRKGQAFEVLDLLSVPEELQMAELFGWKRGAFTGAVKDSQGAVARAQGGTLFLDEIDKLSLKAQAGLLHVLEERRYRPLGDDTSERRADVRFLVGTNADLRASVAAGRFREDLYYRISVLPVRLPSLRERLDELPLWAEHMLARRHGRAGATLTPRAQSLLLEAPWPGNLRQLDNVIRRAYALALPERSPNGGITLDARHVEQALAYEGAPESGSLFSQLWRAATAWINEAEKRPSAALSLDQSESFRGFVLGAALQKLGNRDQAFSLLGQSQAVKHRNHHKILRREFDKVRALARSLGEVGSPVAAFDELEHAPDSLSGKGTDERGDR